MYRNLEETLRAQVADLEARLIAQRREASQLEKELQEVQAADDGTHFLVHGERRHTLEHRQRAMEERLQREGGMDAWEFLLRVFGITFKAAGVGMAMMFLSIALGMLRDCA